jgi:hypothetical protein
VWEGWGGWGGIDKQVAVTVELWGTLSVNMKQELLYSMRRSPGVWSV